jgi:hypothetical protein
MTARLELSAAERELLMYLKGTIEIDLTGTEVTLRPPSGFFRGVGNLMTGGRWGTREEHETYKLLALSQAIHRVLVDLGVRDVIRVAVGPTVIYEDFNQRPDDFEPAMEELRRRIEMDGLELGPNGEFDLLLSHEDDILKKTLDLDFRREHRPGEWPLAIRVTGIPVELRRQPDETDEAFEARLRGVLAGQGEYDRFRERLETRLRAFLDEIVAGLRGRLGIENVRVTVQTEMLRGRAFPDQYTAFGGPFYGYDPTWDLAYLWLWSDLMGNGWGQRNYNDSGFGGWPAVSPSGDFGVRSGEPAREPVPVSSSGGGADLEPSGTSSDSGGGADLQPSAMSSDAGGGADLQGPATEHGGGWLSSITDFFSGHSSDSGDSVGGIDLGGDSGGGADGGSGCGSGDGGGGCGSGCGGGGGD